MSLLNILSDVFLLYHCSHAYVQLFDIPEKDQKDRYPGRVGLLNLFPNLCFRTYGTPSNQVFFQFKLLDFHLFAPTFWFLSYVLEGVVKGKSNTFHRSAVFLKLLKQLINEKHGYP